MGLSLFSECFLRVYERKNRWSAPQKWTLMISTYNLGGHVSIVHVLLLSGGPCMDVPFYTLHLLYGNWIISSFCLRIELLWTFTCRFLCAHNYFYNMPSSVSSSLCPSPKAWNPEVIFSLFFQTPIQDITALLEKASQCRRCKGHGFNPWIGKIPWNKKWQPTPVFLLGKFHGQRNLEGYGLWGLKESDTTEWISMHCVIPTLAVIY